MINNNDFFVTFRFVFLFADQILFIHALENCLLPGDSIFIIDIRGENAGAVDDTDQHCQFTGIQMLQVFPEIIGSGFLDADNSMSEIQCI